MYRYGMVWDRTVLVADRYGSWYRLSNPWFGLIELVVGSVMFSLHYCSSELKFLYVLQIIRLLIAYGLAFDV